MKLLSFLIVVSLVVFVGGCSSSTEKGSMNGSGSKGPDTTTTSQTSGDLGSFKIVVNHDTLNQSKYPDNCMAEVSYYDYGIGIVPGKHYLELNLTFSRTKFVEDQIFFNFTAPVSGPIAATYAISTFPDQSGVYASLDSSPSDYGSKAGGTFSITTFDTVNNLLSGTFTLLATRLAPAVNTNDVDTITGSFTNVGISMGAFGQGAFTAIADSAPFHPRYNGMYDVRAYSTPGKSIFTIVGLEDDTTSSRTLELDINTPTVGTFVIGDDQSAGTALGSYSVPIQNLWYSTGQTSGSLTITQFDTVARRISGTFSFTAQTNAGQSVQVTSGVIDNLQWVAE